jgi:hypothetical protein
MTKTEIAWDKIFENKKFDVSRDLHYITAAEIKSISGEEARIVAKADYTSQLPKILKDNGYFLLPVENGTYAIVRGNGFHELEAKVIPISFTSNVKFNLTTAARGMSEMQYLDYSYYSGALEKVLGLPTLYQTIRGRERSKKFDFKVGKIPLSVSSVQLEVDSGLEGKDSIVLIEAKVNTPKDFIIRQLFYPYNHFKIISPAKKIIPIFFTYEPATKTYNFWIYEFTDQKNYNSIRLKEIRSLVINTKDEFKLEDIKPTGVVKYKKLIPQANDVDKIVELIFKIKEGINNHRDVAEYFKFAQRQSAYYREAAEALGLVNKKDGEYFLTEIAEELIQLPVEQRNFFISNLLAGFPLVKQSLAILKRKGKLDNQELETLVIKNTPKEISDSTVYRRLQSLRAWLKWISKVTGTFKYTNGLFTFN